MINFEMNNGRSIPAMGYGVFQMTSEEVGARLPEALEVGFRHIDTANAYYNEVAVGRVIGASGIDRGDLFVTTKLFPQSYPADRVGRAIDDTLRRLDIGYIDLLLLHQPYGEYVMGWKGMERAVEAGTVRSIGLSNFGSRKTREILEVGDIVPAVNQILINPRQNQHAYKAEFAGVGMVYEGWYPLGHGDRALLEDPVFTALADKYGKTNAQIILRWHIQEGNVVFPKTLNPQHMADNLDVFDFELTGEETERINAMPQASYYDVPDEAPAWVWQMDDFDQQR